MDMGERLDDHPVWWSELSVVRFPAKSGLNGKPTTKHYKARKLRGWLGATKW